MHSTLPGHTTPTMRRRSFVVRVLAAVGAGIGSGHLLRGLGQAASPPAAPERRISIRPHPEAVPRTIPRTQSHE